MLVTAALLVAALTWPAQGRAPETPTPEAPAPEATEPGATEPEAAAPGGPAPALPGDGVFRDVGSAAPAVAAASLPAGFTDTVLWSGLLYPTAIAIAKTGRVFVAEQSGLIKTFDSTADATPTVAADLRSRVFGGWDRGLLGLAVDPRFGEAGHAYLYALYAADRRVGGGVWNDQCPSEPDGPGPTTDGCPITAALARLPVGTNGVAGAPEILIQDQWCQQYPSHSIGDLAFGADGALFVSAGDGASFLWADYGQGGGTVIDPSTGQPYTPANPCGDPPGGRGTANTFPTGRGGALRAQSLRRPSGEPALLNGAILRIDPATGNGLPDNPLAGSADPNARRIVAFGFRNPFRFAVRPNGTLWVGDVGLRTWEEINRMPSVPAAPVNNGWPCYEGAGPLTAYASLTVCQQLSAATTGGAVSPYFAYRHDLTTSANDTCRTGSSAIAGLAFGRSASWPQEYRGALFFADHNRSCIWVMPTGANGRPDPTQVRTFVDSTLDPDPVDLEIHPKTGDLFYVDIDSGKVHRISYSEAGVNRAPTAIVAADPTYGEVPLTVTFDGRGSVDPDGDLLTYRWDLDGDGAFDDGRGATIQRTYTTSGVVQVRLRVQDPAGLIGRSAPFPISPGNTPPTVTITAPTPDVRWAVGQPIAFSGTADDAQDGTLSGASMEWVLVMEHCPSDCHEHVIGTVGTGTSGSFVPPDHEYPSSLELRLTATDGGGLSTTETVWLDPQTVTLTFDTAPSGLWLTVDGIRERTPYTRTAIVGGQVQLVAPWSQKLGGITYTYASWSDGKGRSHAIAAPATAATYTATYAPAA